MSLTPINPGSSLPEPTGSKYNREIDHQYVGTPSLPTVSKGAVTPRPLPKIGASLTSGSAAQSAASPALTSAATVSISREARGAAQIKTQDTLA